MFENIHAWKNCAVGCGLLLGVIAAGHSAQARGYTVAYKFTGGADGQSPSGGLASDDAGNIYGTTFEGGSADFGTVFMLAPNGQKTTCYSFTNGHDGDQPRNGVIVDSSGNLFGTTWLGGTMPNGMGTIFKVSCGGRTETTLHEFAGPPDDGSQPVGRLVEYGGVYYGVTSVGGANNRGSVYRIKPDGSEYQIVHSFCGDQNCAVIPTGLAADQQGNLYGFASGGDYGHGVAFRVGADGNGFQIIHSFRGAIAGSCPVGAPVLDGVGHLYGMTFQNGVCDYGYGSVFSLSLSGRFKTLHEFTGGSGGGAPLFGLTLDNGTLFGATTGLGANAAGGIGFKLKTNGANFKVLHVFDNQKKGLSPSSPPLLDSTEFLYGTSFYGGIGCDDYNGCGVIFKMQE